ncbi:hypothetical protein ACFX10_003097 [Malus domestica]
MAPIAVGDVIPDDTLAYFDEDKVQSINIHSLAAGKKAILFGVFGAFTPTCTKYTHDLGLELDLSEKGLGTRFKRFALRFNTHDFSKSDTLDELSILTLNYLGCIGVSGLDDSVEDERGLDQVHASTCGLMTSKEVVAELMSDGL